MKVRNTVTERRYQRANAMQVGRALASVEQVLASMKVLTANAYHLPFATREAIRVAFSTLHAARCGTTGMAGVGYRAESDQVSIYAEKQISVVSTDNYGDEHRFTLWVAEDATLTELRLAAHNDLVQNRPLGARLPNSETCSNSRLLKYALRLREAEADLEQAISNANDPYPVKRYAGDDTDE